MGCGAAKGKAAKQLTLADIKFKPTQIKSVDAFFGNCNNIMAQISDIIIKLFDFRINFLKLCAFDTVPGSCKIFSTLPP